MIEKKKKLSVVLLTFVTFITALVLWILWGNTALELNRYKVTSDEIPQEFYGFCIAQVSDLHNTEIGEDNEKLLSMLREAEPDIIAITGDLIDSRNTDIYKAVSFAEKAIEIAPCYYVTGNHEARVSEYGELKSCLEDAGVIILDNEQAEFEREGKRIILAGLADPSFKTDYLFDSERYVAEGDLYGLLSGNEGYTVLLAHRPELFDVYSEYGADLILSGHAHGGQFRIPFIGGLYAPHQGFLPEYDGGLYTQGESNMIVSRGVGNSIFPFRLNNRPEVVLIELQGRIS